MKNIFVWILFLLLLAPCASYAQNSVGTIDYGTITDNAFKFRLNLRQNELFSSISIYYNQGLNVEEFEKEYALILSTMTPFLRANRVFAPPTWMRRDLVIRVISLRDINSPNNFSDGKEECTERNPACTAFFVGRFTFRPEWSHVVIYLTLEYATKTFWETFAHEYLHAMLYTFKTHLSVEQEEALCKRYGIMVGNMMADRQWAGKSR